MPQVGQPIPVHYQAANYDSTQFPRAVLMMANGNPHPDSPVDLEAANDTGLYLPAEPVAMPNTPWVLATICVYADSDHEELSTSLGADDQTYELTPESNAGAVPSYIQAFLEPDSCNPGIIQDTIIQGSDRTLTVRLVDAQNIPFDLEGATEIEFKFRKENGTALSLKLTDVGNPVVIINALSGIVECTLTAAQTLLLAARTPAPFSIVVTQPVGTTVINVATQLSIEPQEV